MWVQDFKVLANTYRVRTCAECIAIGLIVVSWQLLDKTRKLSLVGWQFAMAIFFESIAALVIYIIFNWYYGIATGRVKHPLAFPFSWTYIIAASFMWMSLFDLLKLFVFMHPIGCALGYSNRCAAEQGA